MVDRDDELAAAGEMKLMNRLRYLPIALGLILVLFGVTQLASARSGACQGTIQESRISPQNPWVFNSLTCAGDCSPNNPPCKDRPIGTYQAGTPPQTITITTCTCMDSTLPGLWTWDQVYDTATETFVTACDATTHSLPSGAVMQHGCEGGCNPNSLDCVEDWVTNDPVLRSHKCKCQ